MSKSKVKVKGVFKADKWWDSKLTVMAVLIYFQISTAPVVPPLGKVLATIGLFLITTVGIAAFGYLLNDFCDREQDKQSGARNMVGNKSPLFILGCFALVLLLSWLPWRWLPTSPVIWALLIGEYLLFIAYSTLPIRLKERGFFGAAADALYGYTIPLAVSSLVFAQLSGSSVPLWFGALLAIWTFLLGLRQILNHQMEDVSRDQLAGVKTFVTYRGWKPTFNFLNGVLFPLELVSFLLFLIVLGTHSLIIPVGFILYSVWVLFKQRYLSIWQTKSLLQLPAIDKLFFFNTIIMSQFQTRWLPLLILASIILREPQYLILAALHLLLFENGLKALRNDEFLILHRLRLWPRLASA